MSHQYMTEEEIRAAEQRCQQATPGPLTVEKHESFAQGCWHYAIKTTYHPAEHPHSPRFVAWMCGSLGESIHSRRHPDDYRSDPQIEADADLFAHARTDLPRALSDLRELRRVVREQSQKLDKVATWLERNAQKLEESAKNNRFKSLAEAELADARNYRATAKDIRVTLALARQVEGGK